MALRAVGQEALRASLTGQYAAEARKRALSAGLYNVRWGDLACRLSAGLDTVFTDNVRFSAQQPQADILFQPQLDTFSVWFLSDKNRLNLSFGVGYAKYMEHPEYDGLFVTPGSDLSLDFYVQDFKITLHDRFAYSQDVTGDPTISGVGRLSRFENTTGASVIWDLNKALLTVGYDHLIYLVTEEGFSYQDRTSELFSASAAFMLTPTVYAGLEAAGGLTDYRQDWLSDNTHVSIGPMLMARPSPYTTFRLSFGYVIYFLESSRRLSDPDDVRGLYAAASLNHRLGKVLTHTLAAGRQLESGLFSSAIDVWYLQWQANWNLIRQWRLTTGFSFEHGRQQYGISEQFDRYGGNLGLSRSLGRHVSARLAYQFYHRASNQTSRDYTQNRLALGLTYQF